MLIKWSKKRILSRANIVLIILYCPSLRCLPRSADHNFSSCKKSYLTMIRSSFICCISISSVWFQLESILPGETSLLAEMWSTPDFHRNLVHFLNTDKGLLFRQHKSKWPVVFIRKRVWTKACFFVSRNLNDRCATVADKLSVSLSCSVLVVNISTSLIQTRVFSSHKASQNDRVLVLCVLVVDLRVWTLIHPMESFYIYLFRGLSLF